MAILVYKAPPAVDDFDRPTLLRVRLQKLALVWTIDDSPSLDRNRISERTYLSSHPHDSELKPMSHCHGLDAGSVTVLIRDYPWDIRPGSVDMTVMFRDQPLRFRRLGFSVARFSTCSKISFLP